MPKSSEKLFCERLREKRKACYPSAEVAAAYISKSPEAIGRAERGEVMILPHDAIYYSDCYRSPTLLADYCAYYCPVGERRQYRCQAKNMDMLLAACRYELQAHESQETADTLKRILYDGVIDQEERGMLPELREAVMRQRNVSNELLRELDEQMSVAPSAAAIRSGLRRSAVV